MESKVKVLIVEDEAIIAENIKYTLEELGYEVVDSCYTYDDALVKISECGFDILLLDIHLGDHFTNTGLDLAKRLPAIKKVPFIFVTAYKDTDTIIKAAKLKPSAYIVKPIEPAALFAALQTAFENYNNDNAAAPPGTETAIPDHFYAKVGNKLAKVAWSDVFAIVAIKNYIKLLTPDMSGGFLIRTSLSQAHTSLLPNHLQKDFTFISRNTLLRNDVIVEIKSNMVITAYGNFETTKVFPKSLNNTN